MKMHQMAIVWLRLLDRVSNFGCKFYTSKSYSKTHGGIKRFPEETGFLTFNPARARLDASHRTKD